MSLRIGGYAAILGGLLWLIALAANAINDGAEAGWVWLGPTLIAAVVCTLIALIGLSAFQARRHPALAWAAFAIPALGAVIGLSAMAATIVNSDSNWTFAGLGGWEISLIGLLLLLLGSGLFALATWRTRSLSREAALLLLAGALVVVPGLAGISGSLVPEPLVPVLLLVTILVFPAGWVAMGISALRVGPPVLSIDRTAA